jgi:hypothetical protein
MTAVYQRSVLIISCGSMTDDCQRCLLIISRSMMTAVYQRSVLIISRVIMTAVYKRFVLIISRDIMTAVYQHSVLIIYFTEFGAAAVIILREIRVITKFPNSEQSYKGKVKTHKYINRQNQSTTGKL